MTTSVYIKSSWYVGIALLLNAVISLAVIALSSVEPIELATEIQNDAAKNRLFSKSSKEWLAFSRQNVIRYAVVEEAKGTGISDTVGALVEADFSGRRIALAARTVEIGWPLKSFRSNDEWPIGVSQARPSRSHHCVWRQKYFSRNSGGLWLSLGVAYRPDFPREVKPLGFIGNMLIYAAVVAAIFRAFSVIVTLCRHRSGLCTNCGYCLAGVSSEVCPECGGKYKK